MPFRHECLTSDFLGNPLAAAGPKAASGACHYPFHDERPRLPPGSDRHARPPHPNPRRRNNEHADLPHDERGLPK